MGRPSKLNPQTTEKLRKALRMGATYELACKYAGVSYQTFNEWRKLGEQATRKGAFSEFLDAIKAAEGEAAFGWLEKIEAAADHGSWQAAAWKLERRYPKQYGRTVHELTGEGGGPVETVSLTLEEWRAQAEQRRREAEQAAAALSGGGRE